jgi:hypothetical protein
MSYPNPDTSSLTLKGIDNVIQNIQQKVKASLSWIDQSFGLTDRIVEERNEKPYVFPAIFQEGMDPVSMMPSDEWSNFCFWTKEPEVKIEGGNHRMLLGTYTVNCIFYVDIKRTSSLNYKTAKTYMVNDILNFFNTVQAGAQMELVSFIEDDITEVYKGFTLSEVDNRLKMYPKWACKVTCQINVWEPCYSANSYA